MKQRGEHKQRGMTLIEVLVALAIFAIAGGAVIKATSDHISSVGRIKEITIATWVANNQLNNILMLKKWPLKNNEKGQTEMANQRWFWQQKVAATNDDALKQITIEIYIDDNYSSLVTSVSTFIAQPSESSE